MEGGATERDIEERYKEMVTIQRDRARCFENWKFLLQVGMDKTYHPSLFSRLKARTYAVMRPSPRVLGGWEHDSQGITSAKPRA